MKKDLWYAVSKEGVGTIFSECPQRNTNFGVWTGLIISSFAQVIFYLEEEGFKLPNLKWCDEPIKITISVGF